MAVASGGSGWRESVRWDPVIYRSSKFSVKLRVCALYASFTVNLAANTASNHRMAVNTPRTRYKRFHYCPATRVAPI